MVLYHLTYKKYLNIDCNTKFLYNTVNYSKINTFGLIKDGHYKYYHKDLYENRLIVYYKIIEKYYNDIFYLDISNGFQTKFFIKNLKLHNVQGSTFINGNRYFIEGVEYSYDDWLKNSDVIAFKRKQKLNEIFK